MSKYVKNLISDHLRSRLDGVEELLVVNVIGCDANATSALRKRLREKGISLMVVKNSMVARATEGSVLAQTFEGVTGTLALTWGCEDIVSLAKEIIDVQNSGDFDKFEARGGIMDGASLDAEQVKEVSKWPTRPEQLSLLMGQVLAPGANLSGALLGPGGLLASQIEQKGEGEEASAEGEPQ